jgi:hypothetical protein
MITNPRPFPPEDETCELCEAARFTHWYAETEHGWVADCEVCSVPMVVWWHHGTEPETEAVAALHAALGAAADERFGQENWYLDTTMRQIPTHFHAHARDRDWHQKRFSRAMSKYTGVGGERSTHGHADGGGD